MPILLAGAAIGGISSLFGSRSARNSQKEANQIQREGLQFARDQDAWVKGTLRPELQQEQERLRGVGDAYGGYFDGQRDEQDQWGDSIRGRIGSMQRPLEDRMYAEANAAGGYEDQEQEAGRAVADVRQANSNNRQQGIRTGRAYGADLNRLMAMQADQEPMAALAEASAMSKARSVAKQLGYDKRAGMLEYGKSMYGAADAAAGRSMDAASMGLGARSAASKFALESGRLQVGAAGQVGDLYSSQSRSAASMFDSQARSSASSSAGYGSFIGQNAGKISDAASRLWDKWGSDSTAGQGSPGIPMGTGAEMNAYGGWE